MTSCPVCAKAAGVVPETNPPSNANVEVNCPSCGVFRISTIDAALYAKHPELVPRLSHGIRLMQGCAVPFVTREIAESLVTRPLPSLREQQDSFIRWLGDKLRANNPAERYSIVGKDSDEFCAVIGAFNGNYAWQIVRDLNAAGLVEWDSAPTNIVRITTAGWDRYEEIERAPSAARLAFMAMPFRNSQLDQVFKECFKPAVHDTGFELRRLDEGQPAGLIDDQLRVRIRSSWFLVAELTTENRGVYWEAGFAEGLGRPVIYTCQESKSKELQTHFDTNHHLTVVWEPDKFAEAGAKLKATIRATLPAQVKQVDG